MGVYENIKRKTRDASKMFDMLVFHMNNELKIKPKNHTNQKINLPTWL